MKVQSALGRTTRRFILTGPQRAYGEQVQEATDA